MIALLSSLLFAATLANVTLPDQIYLEKEVEKLKHLYFDEVEVVVRGGNGGDGACNVDGAHLRWR